MKKQQITVVKNNGKEEQAILLLQFRNLIVSQLFLINKTIITKNIFDGVHYSMMIRDEGRVIGGLCFFQITQYRCVNIIYFAVHPQYQAKGFGTFLLNKFKQLMRDKDFDTIVTQADIISLNFYFKNGFIQFHKKKKIIDRQPTHQQFLDHDDQDQNISKKFKKYQPWLQYIEDYYSSVLVVYKIGKKINCQKFAEIAKNQKEQLINKLNQKDFRGLTFKRQQMEQLLRNHREKYEAQNGILMTSEKIKSLKEKICEQKIQVTSNEKIVSKMEQLALLDILKSHPSSWILKLKFIKLPGAYNNTLSNIITIHSIEERIANDHYKSSSQMCADLTKVFENLKLFLAQGTSYHQACDSLQSYMEPYFIQICTGIFNAKKYFEEKDKKEQNEGKNNIK